MSGALAAFESGIEATNSIGSLAFGATGGVVLGDFSFDGFEVPAYVTFGGKQQMTVHRLVGGERVVDLLGPDESNITWAGTFLDNDPAARAQQLDQMRAAGDPLPLVWGEFYYSVVIESFTADTRYYQVPYRITCLVLRNEATAPAGSQQDDLTSAVGDDMTSAVDAAPADASAAVTSAQTSVAGLGQINFGGASIQSALLAVTKAQATVQTLRANAEATITAISSRGASVGSVIASAADLATAVSTTGELASLMQTSSYLGRTAINLGGDPWQ